jgi:4-amino-4-deoxy-L-arabinose transferase-like glycosyltransferase
VTDFKKKELLFFYGGAYLLIAILITVLFLFILGDFSLHNILVTFSIWGLIWLISMFAFPMFISDVNSNFFAYNPLLALFGYAIIIVVLVGVFFLHKMVVEKRHEKKVGFSKLIDLYFPPPKKKKSVKTKEKPTPSKEEK